MRLRTGAVIVLILVGVAAMALTAVLTPTGSTRAIGPGTEGAAVSTPAAAPGLVVHVLGAVRRPGLYELAGGARVVDAIAAAGGFTEHADETALNLAGFVSDAEQLYVPEIGELDRVPAGRTADGRVDLNAADSGVLESLPGVGPELAARILAWRDANGRFSSVEDLKNVRGIGEKTFAALRDLVAV